MTDQTQAEKDTKDTAAQGAGAAVKPSVESKKTDSGASNWAMGIAVVAIGGLLLARNLGVNLSFLNFHNWWAIFILLAAVAPLQQAFSRYQSGGWSNAVLNSLISAGAIIVLALLFLLDLSLWTWWPVFIIIGGLMMMTNRND